VSSVLPFPSNGRRVAERVDSPGTDTSERRFRDVLGEVLRAERLAQGRTLSDVATDAAVSLPYLSEVERGRKDVSSDVLHSICDALELPVPVVLERSADRLRLGTGAQGPLRLQLLAA
jgi:transcriptional regulator with XRE-family HTH domain